MEDSKFVLAAVCSSLEEATAAGITLEEARIPVLVDPNDASGAFPNLQEVKGIHLLVPEDQLGAARELLDERVPLDELVEEDADELSRAEATVFGSEKPSRSFLPRVCDVLLLVTIGFLLGFLCTHYGLLEGFSSWLPTDSRSRLAQDANGDGKADNWLTFAPNGDMLRFESDQNFDGSPDAWYVYKSGIPVRSRLDRDFDGVPDAWYVYESGIPIRSKLDRDFDGSEDTWEIYESGILMLSKIDIDGDETPDVYEHYEHGVVSEVEWRPTGNEPVRREVYSNGVLQEVYVRTPSGMKLSERLDRSGAPLPLTDLGQ